MEIVEMTGDSPVVARVSYDLYSPEYKRGMVLEWANSGSSQKGFAREKGIPDTTFSGWVKKWRAEGCPGLDGAEGPSAGPALVEAAPAAGAACGVFAFCRPQAQSDSISTAASRMHVIFFMVSSSMAVFFFRCRKHLYSTE